MYSLHVSLQRLWYRPIQRPNSHLPGLLVNEAPAVGVEELIGLFDGKFGKEDPLSGGCESFGDGGEVMGG